MTNLDSILKSRDITLPTKVRLVKAMVFPVVMYGCGSWTVKKAEHRRIDAFFFFLVSIKFYWKTTTLSSLHINYGCFCTTMAKLQRLVMLQRWHGPQTLNIDYLALYRKHLLGVPCQSRGWDSVLSLGVRRGTGLIPGRGPTKCTK